MCVFHIALVLVNNLRCTPICTEPVLGWDTYTARAGEWEEKGPRDGNSQTAQQQVSLGAAKTDDKYKAFHSNQLPLAWLPADPTTAIHLTPRC